MNQYMLFLVLVLYSCNEHAPINLGLDNKNNSKQSECNTTNIDSLLYLPKVEGLCHLYRIVNEECLTDEPSPFKSAIRLVLFDEKEPEEIITIYDNGFCNFYKSIIIPSPELNVYYYWVENKMEINYKVFQKKINDVDLQLEIQNITREFTIKANTDYKQRQFIIETFDQNGFNIHFVSDSLTFNQSKIWNHLKNDIRKYPPR